MAQVQDEPDIPKPPPFLEVVCKSSGKIRRFSAGTEAGFAVKLINKKLLLLNQEVGLASYIEAVVKDEGEQEPVSFGPNSVLVDYGPSWILQTVVEPQSYYDDGDMGGLNVRPRRRVQRASAKGTDDSDTAQKTVQSPISLVYFGKILLAFVILFIIGAAFTLALENLPRLILYINSPI